jgi:Na+/proline symporter
MAFTFGSVAEILHFFWKVTALVGISFWAGVIWRRANRYGAWASIAGAGAVLLLTSNQTLFGISLGAPLPMAEQIAWYLSVGFAAMIVVSLLTPQESETMLNKFYTVLHTPVGQEQKLRDAGIQVVME